MLVFENFLSVYTKNTASIVFQNSTDLHEYSLVQTSLNIHQYIFLDKKNPGGREHFVLLRNEINLFK